MTVLSLSGDTLQRRSLPDLPLPVTEAGAAIMEGRLYIAGGRDRQHQISHQFLRLALNDPAALWEARPPWPGYPRAAPILVGRQDAMCLLAPLVRRLKISTSNEYLERRFGVVARLLGSLIYSVTQIMGRMGPVMLLPSFDISAVTGIPVWTCILIMGVITTLYTYLGGLEAVIWTDTVQGFVMIASVIGCLIMVWIKIDQPIFGPLAGLGTAPRDRLHVIDLTLDITYPVFWVFLISSIIGTLSGIGDQNFVQRVQCTPSLKQTRTAVATQIGVTVPINILLFSFGTGAALWLSQYSLPSVWDIATLYIGFISNGVLGLFGLGLLTKRANQVGALIGVSCGMIMVIYLRYYTPVSFFLYPLFGSAVTFVVGYLASLILPGRPRELEGLTIYSLKGLNRAETNP